MALGWVNPWVGLGWVEDFHNYSGLGWVGSRSLRHAYSGNVDSCSMHSLDIIKIRNRP